MEPLSAIASIITIFDSIKGTYQTVKTINGLPKAFEVVQKELDLVVGILQSAQHHSDIGRRFSDQDKRVLQRSHENAEQLKKVMDAVEEKCKRNGDTNDWPTLHAAYRAALRSLKTSRVERLMQEILEDMKMLALDRVFQLPGKEDFEALNKAIDDLSTVTRSDFDTSNGGQINISNQGNARGHGISTVSGENTFNLGEYIMSGSNPAIYSASFQAELPPDSELIELFKVPGLEYERFKDRNPSPVEGTCKWLDENPSYIKWTGEPSEILLVTANPGCGKSVLAKSVVDKLQEENLTRVCHFFFKDDSQIQSSATKALCSLLHQLFVKFTGRLPESLKSYIAKNKTTIRDELSSLWELLELASETRLTSESEDRKPIVCVLDALDECEESGRNELLHQVGKYFAGSRSNYRNHKLKFFFTGRPTPAVIGNPTLSRKAINLIHIEDDDKNKGLIRREIQLVIKDRVDELADSWKLDGKEKNDLSQCFQGDDNSVTYLWVDLLYKELQNPDNTGLRTKEWLDLARSFPPTVDSVYNKILSGAKNQEETRTMLHIILAAKRPLTWEEMDKALEIRCRPNDFNLTKVEPRFQNRIRASVGFFVTIHYGRVYFIHQTAREFLLKPYAAPPPQPIVPMLVQVFIVLFTPWALILENLVTEFAGRNWKHAITLAQANCTLAEICIAYLSSGKLSSHQELVGYPFGAYAAMVWFEHIQQSHSLSRELVDLFMGSPDSPSTVYTRWLEWWINRSTPIPPRAGGREVTSTKVEIRQKRELRRHCMFVIDSFDDSKSWGMSARIPTPLSDIVPISWRDIHHKDSGNTMTCDRHLGLIMKTYLKIVWDHDGDDMRQFQCLVRAMVDVRGRGSLKYFHLIKYIYPALFLKIAENTFKAILEEEGNVRVLAELSVFLWANAPVEDPPDDRVRTLLLILAERDQPEDIKFLVKRGVSVNTVITTGKSATALIAAMTAGKKQNFDVLLEAQDKDDINITGLPGDFGTALIAACTQSDAYFTRRLIERGAVMNAKATTGRYGTALIAAIMAERAENVNCLLKRKDNIKVNLQALTGDFGTALIAACALRNRHLTRHLADDHGAEINATTETGQYETALIAACATNNPIVVRQLLGRGADIDISVNHSEYPTALVVAIRASSAWSVSQLIDKYGNNFSIDTKVIEAFTYDRFGPPSTELSYSMTLSGKMDEAAYSSAAQRLNIALILRLLKYEGLEHYFKLVKDASRCLTAACSTTVNLQAAKVAAHTFGMDDITKSIAEEWCSKLRSFSDVEHDCYKVLDTVRMLLMQFE